MNTARYRIWIAGQGGQGCSFLSQLICQAAYIDGLHVSARNDTQWAIRGGQTVSWVFLNDTPFSPAAQQDFNWVLLLHPSARADLPPLAPEACILDAYALKLYEPANALGFAQGLNMLLLGLFLARSHACRTDAVIWQLRQVLGKEQVSVLPYNLALLEQGLALDLDHSAAAEPEAPANRASAGPTDSEPET